MMLETTSRIGDFTPIPLVTPAQDASASVVSLPLHIGEFVLVTANVSYSLSAAIPSQKRRKQRPKTNTEARFVLSAEGTADSAVIPIDFPANSCSSQLSSCLFQLQQCWFSAETTKKTEKDFNITTNGKVVLTGEEIQLKHVTSGKYLSFSSVPNTIGYQIRLSSRTDSTTWLKFLAGPRDVQSGRAVLHGRKMAIAAKCGEVDCFLNLNARVPSYAQTVLFEVSSYTQESYFEISLFQSPCSETSMVLCEIVQFRHKELRAFLSYDTEKGQLVMVKDENHAMSYWRLEPETSENGGQIQAGTKYFLRNIAANAYLSKDFVLEQSPKDLFQLLLTGKTNLGVIPDMDLTISNSESERIRVKTDEIQGQDVFRMVPTGQNKDSGKAILLTGSKDFSDESLFVFEIRKVPRKDAEFVGKTAAMVQKFEAAIGIVGERDAEMPADEYEKRLRNSCEWVCTGTEFLAEAITNAQTKEARNMLQSLLTDCGIHLLLLHLCDSLIVRLNEFESTAQTSSISLSKKTKSLRNSSKNPMEIAFAEVATSVFADVLTLFNYIAYGNLATSTKFSLMDEELRRFFPFNKNLTANLLTEIYRLVDPPIVDYENYYKQWFERLHTVAKSNVDEQTTFLRLLHHVSEQDSTVNPLSQAELLKLFRPGPQSFPLIHFHFYQSQPCVSFPYKFSLADSSSFLRNNPDLAQIAIRTEQEELLIPLYALEGSKAMQKYAKYVSEALLVVNVVCMDSKAEVIEETQGRIGLSPEIFLQFCEDEKLGFAIRRGLLILSTSFILSNPKVNTMPLVRVPTLIERKDLTEEQSGNPAALEIRRLVTWCLRFWLHDFSVRNSASEAIEFLEAALRLTEAVVEKGHGTATFVRAISPAFEYLLIGLISPNSDYLPQTHWTVRFMSSIAAEQKTSAFGLLQSLKHITSLTIRQIKTNRKVLSHCKTKELMQIFTKNGTENAGNSDSDVRNIVITTRVAIEATKETLKTFLLSQSLIEESRVSDLLASIHTTNLKLEEFLCSIAFSAENFDSDTRNSLMDLLVSIVSENEQLAKSFQSTQFLDDSGLVSVKEKLAQVAIRLKLTNSEAKLMVLMRDKEENGELIEVEESLKTLLGLLTCRNAKKDILQSTQDMARSLGLHFLLVQLWTVADKFLQDETGYSRSTINVSLFRLTADCIYYFVLGNEQNRLELVKIIKSSFFNVYTRNAAYIIQELTDFEHVPQHASTLCYRQLIQKCLFSRWTTTLWSGLNWIKASIHRRDTAAPKTDLQIVAALSIFDLFQSRSDLEADTLSMSLVIELLAETAEGNEAIQRKVRDQFPLPALIAYMQKTDAPNLFLSYFSLLAECYSRPKVEITDAEIASILEITNTWLDRLIAGGRNSLRRFAFSGRFSHSFPRKSPEIVDIHGDSLDFNSEGSVWRLLINGDPWKRENGLCVLIPKLVIGAERPGQDLRATIRTTAGRIREVARITMDFAVESDTTVYSFYLQRAVLACYEAVGLYLAGERTESRLFATFSASETAVLHEISLLDKLYSKEIAMEDVRITATFTRARTQIELFGLKYAEFARIVMRVCSELSSSQGFQVKAMLFRLPVLRELRLERVPYKVQAQAIPMLKIMVRRLNPPYRGSIFQTLSLLLEESRDKLMAREVFTAAGVAAAAIAAVNARTDLETMKSAVKLMRKLLETLGNSFQEWLLEYFKQTETYMGIFQLLSEELTCAADRFAFKSLHVGSSLILVPSERLLLPNFFTSGMSVFSLITTNFEMTLALVQLLATCCEGCFTPFQVFFATQNQGEESLRGSINVVTLLANFIVNLGEKAPEALRDEQARQMLNACTNALVELVTGPCALTQQQLGSNLQLLSALARLIQECKCNRKSKDCLELFSNILAFLHSLLEGEPSQEQLEVIGNYLHIPALSEAMEETYNEYISTREKEIIVANYTDPLQEANIDIGFSIAMLIMKLKGMLPSHADLLDFDESSWSRNPVYHAFDLGVMRHIPRNCFGFYASLIGYVELSRKGVIEGAYFRIPFQCKFLTAKSKRELIVESMATSQLQKLFNFLRFTDIFSGEMTHQQMLYRSPWLKTLSQAWEFWGMLSFCLILIISLVLVVKGTFDTLTYMDEQERGKPFTMAIVVLSAAQLGVSLLSFIGYVREYYPNILARAQLQVNEELEFSDYPSLWHNESIFITGRNEETAPSQFLTTFHKVRLVLTDPHSVYQLVFFLVSFAAIFAPFLYALLLFDIFNRSTTLAVLVHSVTDSKRQLLNAVALTILVTFMFAMLVLVFFTTYFTDTSNPLYCGSLWECFVSSFLIGVRIDGGGLGIAMRLPQKADELYYPRILLDLLYFAIVIIVIRNIIQGVIVDTFGDMRVQKTELDTQMNQTCFICGASRQCMERALGWAHHFLNEHSLFAYMAFVVYVRNKANKDCTGLEKYVKDCIEQKNCEFFPQTSRYLQSLERKEKESV